MSAIIGFTVLKGVDSHQSAATAQQRALAYFPHLNQMTFDVGESKISIWGHHVLSDCIHYMPDGSVLILVGPEAGLYPWKALHSDLSPDSPPQVFNLPWEGRVVLLRISANGKCWTMWNDWLGSIPVFYAQVGKGWIASTLEPVVVAQAGFTPNDIFLPALLSILIHGHTLGDWSLYKPMCVIPPDCTAEWNEHGFTSKQYFTVRPSTERWETGWDDLIDEMYELTREAIGAVLKKGTFWLLPLSSGLDSRIIAGVGAEFGANLRAYTWGAPHSEDVEYASRIARALGIPWKWIDTGTDYLAKYVQQWADLFGSAMHFHGMYQMPFLDALKAEPSGRILSGFLGDQLAGFDVDFQTSFHSPSVRTYQAVEDTFVHWHVNEIPSLLKMDVQDAFEELACEIDRMRNIQPGPWFQRLRFLPIWGRQRHFTYFQTKLEDYWRGVDVPYLNRKYAQFCLSLPRAVLDHRILQQAMLVRYYGKLAVIPGSFAPEPIKPTGRYLLKKRIAHLLPSVLRRGPFRDFSAILLSRDVESLRRGGDRAIWPLREAWNRLSEWVNLDLVEREYQSALSGNMKSVRKLQSLQTLAYRLLDA